MRNATAIKELALRHQTEMAAALGISMPTARAAYLKLAAYNFEYLPEALEGKWDPKDGELPFFSEASLYELVGKGQARTVRALLNQLGRALGFSERELIRREDTSKPERNMSTDFDFLEALIIDEAPHFGPASEELTGALRAFRAWRKSTEESSDHEIRQVKLENLQIGDRVVQRGQQCTILSFSSTKGRKVKKPQIETDQVKVFFLHDGDEYTKRIYGPRALVIRKKVDTGDES